MAQGFKLIKQVLCENNLPVVTQTNPPQDGPCSAGNQYDKTQAFGQIHGSPVVWTQNGGSQYRIYLHGKWDILKSFQYLNDSFVDKSGHPLSCETPDLIATPVDESSDPAAANTGPGGALSLSSNEQLPGSVILWESVPQDGGQDAENAINLHTGLLRAYDAANLKNKLAEIRLDTNSYIKFVPPTIANGRVYMAEVGKVKGLWNRGGAIYARGG